MSEETASGTRGTGVTEIYIRLLNEGTHVLRPTQALPLGAGSYRVLPTGDYDPEDENWEFPPGTIVIAEVETRNGDEALVAKRRVGMSGADSGAGPRG